ncbi:MAG: DUF4166 domain-containing protein [Hyphomicrobiales bacterium]
MRPWKRIAGPEDDLFGALDTARPAAETRPALGDLRFRSLLSQEDWASLPAPIRRRFSKRLADGSTAVYVGEVIETRMSRCGWLLAQLARLIGGPLPTARDAGLPSVVTVTEDLATGGQIWTRLYARRKGFPQIIHSSKRFAGPTGLEEYLGYGIGMALTIHVERRALVFRSAFYYLRVGKRRFALPGFASPGALTVSHAEIGDGRFLFRLEIVHPRFGELIRQSVVFREATPEPEPREGARRLTSPTAREPHSEASP